MESFFESDLFWALKDLVLIALSLGFGIYTFIKKVKNGELKKDGKKNKTKKSESNIQQK